MSEVAPPSKVEILKETSRQFRGTILEQLDGSIVEFSEDNANLLKHHGTYQQDNRDVRGQGEAHQIIMMVRSRIPGGKLTSSDLLRELDLCDEFGNGTLRITSRQGLQLHGVLKNNLKATIRAINERTTLTTLGACGDVNRNVCCCPAPLRNDPVRKAMQKLTDDLAEHFRPKTSAYREIWLTDGVTEETKVAEFKAIEEPIYGTHYLPRKWKIGVALPEDNCVDILTYDLGLLAIHENGQLKGYNIYVGGGQGMKPANKKTFVAVGQKLTFVTPEQAIPVSEAIVKVWRDHGNRSDRQQARIKYLLRDWGLAQFKTKVEEYYGTALPEPHPAEPYAVEDHLGWHEQGDGKWFLGVNVENGRIKDEGSVRVKSALRAILTKFPMDIRLTALQSILLCDIAEQDRATIDAILADHGIVPADKLLPLHRLSIACPALPTCHLSITDSERVMPKVVADIEVELRKLGLQDEQIAVHMTGCPNGCARPYSPDIGLVGKARGKYTLYVGGNVIGSLIGFIFKDIVPVDEVGKTVAPLLAYFKAERQPKELFGDFCARKGLEDLAARSPSFAS